MNSGRPLPGEVGVHNQLHIEHIDPAIGVEIGPGDDLRAGFDAQENVDAQLGIDHVYPTVQIEVGRRVRLSGGGC